MSGSAIAWELFLWFSYRLNSLYFWAKNKTFGNAAVIIVHSPTIQRNNIGTIKYTKSLIRYSFCVFVPITAIAAVLFCNRKGNGTSTATVL